MRGVIGGGSGGGAGSGDTLSAFPLVLVVVLALVPECPSEHGPRGPRDDAEAALCCGNELFGIHGQLAVLVEIVHRLHSSSVRRYGKAREAGRAVVFCLGLSDIEAVAEVPYDLGFANTRPPRDPSGDEEDEKLPRLCVERLDVVNDHRCWKEGQVHLEIRDEEVPRVADPLLCLHSPNLQRVLKVDRGEEEAEETRVRELLFLLLSLVLASS